MTNNKSVANLSVGYAGELTLQKLRGSATTQDLRSLNGILEPIKSYNLSKMIDLGCSYGDLTSYIARDLNINNVCGIDIDTERLLQAKTRGINTYKLDLNKDTLPFADGYFDLVTSFGALEHLIYFDNFFSECFRVLSDGGYILIAMPNLASYINRIALLFGYQPRDVEITQKALPGTLPYYHYRSDFFGHIHSATLSSMKQLMKHYGFRAIKVNPSSPYQNNKLVKVLDKIFSLSPRLSRRFIILGRKI